MYYTMILYWYTELVRDNMGPYVEVEYLKVKKWRIEGSMGLKLLLKSYV